MNRAPLPSAPGTYALVMRLLEPLQAIVGCLGTVTLAAGTYVYVGSAHGPGGLRARVQRHLRRSKPLRWHIDYLTAVAEVGCVTVRCGDERGECAWVRELLALPGASVPVARFGSSDCREHCPAHLVRVLECPETRDDCTGAERSVIGEE